MKNLKTLFNHKLKYPGSLSFYQTTITIGGNDTSKVSLNERVEEIRPALERLLERDNLLLLPTPTRPLKKLGYK